MKNIFILTSISLLFLGCDLDKSSKDITMKISKLYTMKKGDKVIKTNGSSTALIEIHHVDSSKESVIELIQGNATIKRK